MGICAFEHCGNSTYQLERWKKTKCVTHGCLHMHEQCDCQPPFSLYCFPNLNKFPDARSVWVKAIYRKDNVTGKNWEPNKYSRICSNHFVDGKPSDSHPYPTENLGSRPHYISVPKARKRPVPREVILPDKKPCLDHMSSSGESVEDHSYCNKTYCSSVVCTEKERTLTELILAFEELKSNQKSLPAVTNQKVKSTLRFLKNNQTVKTFTGLRSRQSFEDLLGYVSKKASRMRYWRGNKNTQKSKRKFKIMPKKSGPQRKLTVREELLLVLMKLRQNTSHDLLSVIFGISVSVVSSIFNTWIKLLAAELRPLIYWPTKDSMWSTFPKSLPQSGDYRHLCCTIDCTEIFIERPRNLALQALTWSDYKHHNTVKLFIAIAPNGMISYLPPAWGGRASDQYVTRHCGFLDELNLGDVVLADRGFPIQEDLMLRGARLIIPPSASGKSQMSRVDVIKTGQVANSRIHVERAIGQMKYFEILNSTLPINLVPLIDDISTVCAALSNLLPPLVV